MEKHKHYQAIHAFADGWEYKIKTTATCPGEWEPGCDLGANEEFAKVAPTIPAKKTKKVRLIAWLGADHVLRHVEEGFITTDGPYRDVFRVPSEDKEIEVEE